MSSVVGAAFKKIAGLPKWRSLAVFAVAALSLTLAIGTAQAQFFPISSDAPRDPASLVVASGVDEGAVAPRWKTAADPVDQHLSDWQQTTPTTDNTSQDQSMDYDADDDGFIEVSNLDQLNAIRWDLDGDGSSSDAGFGTAFPMAVSGMGCPDAGCIGYELTTDLDFDTDGDGEAGEGDAYWNSGAGWLPIGDRNSPFATTFDGDGHTISNLYVRRGSSSSLFAVSGSNSVIKGVGLLSVAVVGAGYGDGGSLVGENKGTIENSYSDGIVGGCFDYIGGLVGTNTGTIADSHSAGDVISWGGTSGNLLIGAVQDLTGIYLGSSGSRTCYTDGGGLVGRNRGTITDSHSTSAVSGHSDNFGGLVGSNRGGAITGSYATGAVSGNGYADVGGLVGDNDAGTITTSYAVGDVSGRGDNFGGLVGANRGGTVTASYSTGSVTGMGFADIGGLVGDNSGVITASYATGSVSGRGDNHGGLVARNSADGDVSDSYWDTENSGRADSDGGIGHTTAELQAPTGYTGIYANWNVDLDGDGAGDDPWDFRTASQYPAPRNVDVVAPVTVSFAPVDEPAFQGLMVGNRLNAGTFHVDFTSGGRFTESGGYQGNYSYANTGANTGTLTLDYDGEVYGGSCTVHLTFSSANSGAWRYTCASGIQGRGDWSLTELGLEFVEGGSTTRTIPENTPAGVNVGRPVSATGRDDALTYSVSGTDADSFAIVASTGQLRTKDGVTYDYETKNRYVVTVGVVDENDGSDTIQVTVLISNLAPACEPLEHLRAIHGHQNLTVRWDPSAEVIGKARILGYDTEIRQGSTGEWTDRVTFLGRNIGAMVYANLDNGTEYQVRARVITAEGDCDWTQPVSGTPEADHAPDDAEEVLDRFGQQPMGTPDQHWRLLTPGRCRHTGGGVTQDGNCTYENTGPNAGRIFLEFDDTSLGSCEITLAYSSLTAGSFVDECFDAGVNTNVPFDRSFQMPPDGSVTDDTTGIQTTETETQRAPRDQDEFVALVHGREDFIPGLSFGVVCNFGCRSTVDFSPGTASRREYDEAGRIAREHLGTYSYEGTGATSGKLTFTQNSGEIYVFDMEFEPSGNVSMTITDADGNTTQWPGMLHATLELGAQPLLLPIPPSWSAAIAIETDAAPDDYASFNARLLSLNPEHDRAYDHVIIWQTLFGESLIEAVAEVAGYGNSTAYEKVGRNRARVTITFDDSHDTDDVYDEVNWSSTERLFVDSKWVLDLTFESDDTVTFTATRLKGGEPAITLSSGTIDLRGGSINLDEFPAEAVLPDTPPQASGEDRSGVGVAAAVSVRRIGGDDVQTLLVNNTGLQPVAYSPGDWLEPKDGSQQRMMIVGVTQATAAAASDGTEHVLPVAVDGGMVSVIPVSWTFNELENAWIHPSSYANAGSFTQLDVVCMQRLDLEIPTRGARYFSQPKTAAGPVQLCQRDCALNETENVQQCVWACETRAARAAASPQAETSETPSSTLTSPANAKFIRNDGNVEISWDAVEGADHYRVYYDDFFSSGCRLNSSGSPRFCELLAGNVTETTYTHFTPHPARNYYWVVACDSEGCSDIDGDNPAEYSDTRPAAASNAQYQRDGSVIRLSWDAVDGADYYKVYYDDFFSSGCRLNSSGNPSFCDLLDGNVAETTYTHSSPDTEDNYYWVVACNSGGCSDIDSDNPAAAANAKPAAPTNVQYEWDGSVIRLSWDAVDGADYYKVYYDDFFSSGCRLNSSGNPSFCDLLDGNVMETTYTHSSPDTEDNYYWVVACNSGGCSDIDSDNPAAAANAKPAAPTNVQYEWDGSVIRLSWDAVDGADYYKVYYDDFFSSGCRLNSSGNPSFCDLLDGNVMETTYTHSSPDTEDNYYWVVACNSGGCSDIDSDNPAAAANTN